MEEDRINRPRRNGNPSATPLIGASACPRKETMVAAIDESGLSDLLREGLSLRLVAPHIYSVCHPHP